MTVVTPPFPLASSKSEYGVHSILRDLIYEQALH